MNTAGKFPKACVASSEMTCWKAAREDEGSSMALHGTAPHTFWLEWMHNYIRACPTYAPQTVAQKE